eukprot:scaffold20513_cov130-Isochrysis_galbana.AAC.2
MGISTPRACRATRTTRAAPPPPADKPRSTASTAGAIGHRLRYTSFPPTQPRPTRTHKHAVSPCSRLLRLFLLPPPRLHPLRVSGRLFPPALGLVYGERGGLGCRLHVDGSAGVPGQLCVVCERQLRPTKHRDVRRGKLHGAAGAHLSAVLRPARGQARGRAGEPISRQQPTGARSQSAQGKKK